MRVLMTGIPGQWFEGAPREKEHETRCALWRLHCKRVKMQRDQNKKGKKTFLLRHLCVHKGINRLSVEKVLLTVDSGAAACHSSLWGLSVTSQLMSFGLLSHAVRYRLYTTWHLPPESIISDTLQWHYKCRKGVEMSFRNRAALTTHGVTFSLN